MRSAKSLYAFSPSASRSKCKLLFAARAQTTRRSECAHADVTALPYTVPCKCRVNLLLHHVYIDDLLNLITGLVTPILASPMIVSFQAKIALPESCSCPLMCPRINCGKGLLQIMCRPDGEAAPPPHTTTALWPKSMRCSLRCSLEVPGPGTKEWRLTTHTRPSSFASLQSRA